MDARFDDARLAITLMRTVFDLGGLAINHLPVTDLRHAGGRIDGVGARDDGNRRKPSRSGPGRHQRRWRVGRRDPPARRRLHPTPAAGPEPGRTRGAGPALPARQRRPVDPRTPDGRVLFVIPWQGRLLSAPPTHPGPTAPRAARWQRSRLHPRHRQPLPGLAPYPRRRAAPSPGCVRCSGRAEAAAGLSRNIRSRCRRPAWCRWPVANGRPTGGWPRKSSVVPPPSPACRFVPARRRLWRSCQPGAPGDDVFGTDRAIIDSLPGAAQRAPAFTLSEAEVRHGARFEQARNVDLLARRHRALFIDAPAAISAAPAVAAILAEELGWSSAQTTKSTSLPPGGGRLPVARNAGAGRRIRPGFRRSVWRCARGPLRPGQ